MISIEFDFDSNNIKESLDLRIEEQSKSFLSEGGWSCPFVFSFFSLKDILFLFTAVILERKIVLLSKELCLVTGTL